MSCASKYNCCQQSGLCSDNKICKPSNSTQSPWKRFTCECPDGYYGNNCEQPMTSCQDYGNGFLKSGLYKVVNLDMSVYEVYCHFDSDTAWTLVQSHNVANGSIDYRHQKPLFDNYPVSENSVNWSGYRLRRSRMKSIQKNSTFLLFTCDYEKFNHDINESDYLQILLANIKVLGGVVGSDVLDFRIHTSYLTVGKGHGKIGKYALHDCPIRLHQSAGVILHVHIDTSASSCEVDESSCSGNWRYFCSFLPDDCIAKLHRCRRHKNSTTQIWFGGHA